MGLLSDVATTIADALSFLPASLVVAIVALLPIGEVRASVPLAILVLGMPWPAAFVVSAGANLMVVPFVWWFLGPVERLTRRVPLLDRGLDRLFERTRRRNRKRIERFEELGVLLLVALPIPGTGVWTGTLVAYVFDLPRRNTFMVLAGGVFIATALVTLLTVGGIGLYDLIRSLQP